VASICYHCHAAMRVGIDYRPAVLTTSGIGRAVRELVRALAAKGEIEPQLFAHSMARARVPATVPAGARLHRWPVPGRSLPILSRLGLGAERLCASVPVFHWTDYIHPPIASSSVVLTLHDLAFAEDENYHGAEQSAVLLERCHRAAQQARLIVTPTRATAKSAQRLLGLPESKLVVVPFGSDHVPAQPGPNPIPERSFVTCVGTIEPRKNHQRLLEAWQLLPDPRPLLVVIGRPGWECHETVDALRKAQNQGWLRWLQQADDATVYAHIANARALVYPSLLEGFGFPPLEAMALGTPVIAGDAEALREVLGTAAHYCVANEPAKIAQSIGAVLNDRDLGRELVQKGRQRAARFSWADTANGYARAYRQALAPEVAGSPL
jgi:glycosyltransferase involved in cell wall biosynthesis